MKSFRLLGAMLLALLASSYAVAFAAEPSGAGGGSGVVVPWGDWVGSILPILRDNLVAVSVAVVAWVLRKLPVAIADFLQAARVEQLLTRAIDYGVVAVAGATKDEYVTIPVASGIIQSAAAYAVAHAPALAKTLGDTLIPKLLARLPSAVKLPADATAAKIVVAPPAS